MDQHPLDARLHAGGIELPRAGTRSEGSYWLQLEGQVRGREPLRGVDLFHSGSRLWRLKLAQPPGGAADRTPGTGGSFSLPLSALAMPPEFELEVRAVFEDRTHATLATVRGRRELLQPFATATIQPLVITSLGRSGSTVLMRALENHPRVAACPAFQYESRITTYWLTVLRDLVEPASYLRQFRTGPGGTRLTASGWWLADRPPLVQRLADSALERGAEHDAVEATVVFCRQQMEGQYRSIAAQVGRPDAAYFAEKVIAWPNLALLEELYPDGREIVLVRDFRDQLCSALEFFPRQQGQEPPAPLDQLPINGLVALVDAWRRRSERAHLVRYEDLVLQPAETLRPLLRYLGLDDSADVVEQMADAVLHRDPATASHQTTPDVKASIGRWRRDVAPGIREEVEARLAFALEAFGYS